MNRFVVALTVLLGSCVAGAGEDGYKFERREFDRPTVEITKVEHASVAELRSEAQRLGVRIEGERDAFAFGFVYRNRPACTIHFVRPETEHRPTNIGHEAMHCFYGRWHD